MTEVLTYTPESTAIAVETLEIEIVSPAVVQLELVLNNPAWANALPERVGYEQVNAFRQELGDILADPERKAQLDDALAVWGDCRGDRQARSYFADPDGNVPDMVHSGVLHCFANMAVKGKDRFKLPSIQAFIDMSRASREALQSEVDNSPHISQPMGSMESFIADTVPQRREEIADEKGGVKVLVKKDDWVLIARVNPGKEEVKLITAIPGYNDRRFNKLVLREQVKQQPFIVPVEKGSENVINTDAGSLTERMNTALPAGS